MNLRMLVSPALYGGGAAVAVAALGYALAASQSVPLPLAAMGYAFVGLTAFSLLAGTSSLNENSETPDTIVDEDGTLSAPTEAGAPRRLLLVFFALGISLAGILGFVFLG